MNIERIGVIGAGQMGNGIAQVCALAGYEVLINDVKRERIDAAFEIISGNLSRQVARGKISDADKDSIVSELLKQGRFVMDSNGRVSFLASVEQE